MNSKKRVFLTAFILFVAVMSTHCTLQHEQEPMNNWRVEIGPPGNEYYHQPDTPNDVSPPSGEIYRKIRLVTPTAEVDGWEPAGESYYEIDAIRGHDEYEYLFTRAGEFIQLEYENDSTDGEEEPDKLLLRGTRQEISPDEVPAPALEVISAVIPGGDPARTWVAETVAGRRYVVQAGSMAFYVRPDGQISAAGLVRRGALNEIDPPPPSDRTAEQFQADLDSTLGPYRGRFRIDRQLERLRTGSGAGNNSFRFVAMGDSKGNEHVWSTLINHIAGLDPKPEFVINTGDIVEDGYMLEYLHYFIPPVIQAELLFFPALGNHDDGDDSMARQYRYLFGENSLNYCFDYGAFRFVFVDNVTKVRSADETLTWLEEVLENTPDSRSVIVSAHKPPMNIEKWSHHAWENESASRRFTGLMAEHQVTHVFLGHEHAYSTTTFNGIEYNVTAGGGTSLDLRYGPKGNVHHYVICDARPDGTLQQQVVRFYPRKAIH